MQINFNKPSPKPDTVAGKLFSTIFFSIFLMAGIFFLIMMIFTLCKKMDWTVLAFLLIPLVFIAVGGGGIYFAWKKKVPKIKSGAAAVDKSSPAKQRKIMLFFFSVFFLAGSGFGWMMVGQPLMKIKKSENWSKIPCTIASSKIKESRSDKSTTYKVDITFRYKFKGIKHVGGSYDLMTGSDSGYSSKRKVIDRYPVGKSTSCYVNPENPDEAIISREFNRPWWLALLPLVFILVGLGGIIATLAKKKKTKHVYTPHNDFNNNYETTLKMKSSPLKNFIGMIFFALIWNGIISIFIVKAVRSWSSNNVEWFLSFFMLPFVFVGIATIAGVFYFFIALFNSKVVVTISNPRPQLGEKVTLSWEIVNPGTIETLEIMLKAEEVATYQSGGKNNNTCSRKSIFESIKLLETSSKEAIHIGRTEFTIPSNSMHSFDGKNNKITWEIHLAGDIKRFPNLKCEFPITVMPLNQRSLDRISRSAENGDKNG